MEGSKGTVTISLEELDRLREFEKNITNVRVYYHYDDIYGTSVSFASRDEMISLIIKEKDEECKVLQDELQKCKSGLGKDEEKLEPKYKKLFGRVYIKEGRHEKN